MPATARQNAIQAGIAAMLMLFIGWFFASKGISSNRFYNATVDVFYWSLRVGGILMALVAALCAANLRAGLFFDAIVSGVCGVIMALIAIYWLIDAGGGDLQSLIYVIFGGGFVSASISAMRSYRAAGMNGGRYAEDAAVAREPSGHGPAYRDHRAPVVEAVHPASVRSEALPKDGEPPPPEGYLAALAKEKDEPPTASFE